MRQRVYANRKYNKKSYISKRYYYHSTSGGYTTSYDRLPCAGAASRKRVSSSERLSIDDGSGGRTELSRSFMLPAPGGSCVFRRCFALCKTLFQGVENIRDRRRSFVFRSTHVFTFLFLLDQLLDILLILIVELLRLEFP